MTPRVVTLSTEVVKPPESARRFLGQLAVAVPVDTEPGTAAPGICAEALIVFSFGARRRHSTKAVTVPFDVVSGALRIALATQLVGEARRDSVTVVCSMPPGEASKPPPT